MIAILKKRPRFQPGQVVYHKRYGYRGVIVATAPECRASNEWYQKNQTQPNRNQPWYDVLVHGSTQITYVAESNLEPDASGEPIDHPMVPHFFRSFKDGRYERNEVEWPSGG